MDVGSMDLASLAQRCTQESIKYRTGFKSDPSFCLELWRRALCDNDDDAWTLLVDRYTDDVRGWLYQHPLAFVALRFEEEFYFINETFIRVWMANQHKPLLVNDLGRMIGYAKQTLNTVILGICRTKRPQVPESGPDPGDPNSEVNLAMGPDDTLERVLAKLGAEHVWKCVLKCTHDDRARKLAYLLWLCEWKPREIVATFPAVYASTKQVDGIRRKIVADLTSLHPDIVPANLRRRTNRQKT